MELIQFYNHAKSNIKNNDSDLKWYYDRPLELTRDEFFKTYVWAVWVSGMKRKSADSFLNKINGWKLDWRHFAKIKTESELRQKVSNYHLGYESVPNRAFSKWKAIWTVACKLDEWGSNKKMREELFQGKQKTATLDRLDARALEKYRLPYIGCANSHYIIRNLGGEAIKDDRWINGIRLYWHMSFNEFVKYLKKILTIRLV